jgi:hypothetical protein
MLPNLLRAAACGLLAVALYRLFREPPTAILGRQRSLMVVAMLGLGVFHLLLSFFALMGFTWVLHDTAMLASVRHAGGYRVAGATPGGGGAGAGYRA